MNFETNGNVNETSAPARDNQSPQEDIMEWMPDKFEAITYVPGNGFSMSSERLMTDQSVAELGFTGDFFREAEENQALFSRSQDGVSSKLDPLDAFESTAADQEISGQDFVCSSWSADSINTDNILKSVCYGFGASNDAGNGFATHELESSRVPQEYGELQPAVSGFFEIEPNLGFVNDEESSYEKMLNDSTSADPIMIERTKKWLEDPPGRSFPEFSGLHSQHSIAKFEISESLPKHAGPSNDPGNGFARRKSQASKALPAAEPVRHLKTTSVNAEPQLKIDDKNNYAGTLHKLSANDAIDNGDISKVQKAIRNKSNRSRNQWKQAEKRHAEDPSKYYAGRKRSSKILDAQECEKKCKLLLKKQIESWINEKRFICEVLKDCIECIDKQPKNKQT